MRGSLRFLARPKAALAAQPAKALAAAAHSSACLAANVFGPFLTAGDNVPLGGQSFAGEVRLEAECPTGLKGTPPTLDVLIDGTQVLAIESKCTEPFSVHEASFSSGYEALLKPAHRSWREEFDRLVQDPRRYRYLDAAQLIKHYLGLRACFSHQRITLAYIYWLPVDARDVAACAIHAAEVAEFSLEGQGSGDPVRGNALRQTLGRVVGAGRPAVAYRARRGAT